jgi:hypothetical protein
MSLVPSAGTVTFGTTNDADTEFHVFCTSEDINGIVSSTPQTATNIRRNVHGTRPVGTVQLVGRGERRGSCRVVSVDQLRRLAAALVAETCGDLAARGKPEGRRSREYKTE